MLSVLPCSSMTKNQLLLWVDRHGWTIPQAALVLGLSVPGLNKKLAGKRPITLQEELLIAYVEDRGAPLFEPPERKSRRGRPRKPATAEKIWPVTGWDQLESSNKGQITGSAIDARIGSKSHARRVNRARSVSQQKNAFRPKPVRSAGSPSSKACIPNAVPARMLPRPSTASPLMSPVQLPEKPVIRSKANPSYQKRIDALAAMAEACNWGGIEAYEVKGVNTYAKMVTRYRDQLLQCAPRR
jgi:hypothetical protein